MITDNLEDRILGSKILIIDDEQSMASMLEEILKEEKFTQVRYITDPRKTIDTYLDFKPDLVILDLLMPHMDGFEIMGKLKEIERDSYVSILILTGEMDQQKRLKALYAGAKDFLNKPIDIAETIIRIHNLLEVRLLHNDLRNQKGVLELRVEERTKQLREALAGLNDAHYRAKEAYIETIYRLSLATEYKDEDTSTHIRRMSHYSEVLGIAAGLSRDDIELLLYASPMHDVGKIGIPDRILLKPGPLTAAEWEIMKTHTTIGATILSGSNSPVLKMAEQIALYHHECWSGQGYPKGLRGEQIPLVGRIVMLIDIYDALRSKRPYKEKIDHETACKIMMEGDGRVQPEHFDPNLLAYVKKLGPDFNKIYEDFPS